MEWSLAPQVQQALGQTMSKVAGELRQNEIHIIDGTGLTPGETGRATFLRRRFSHEMNGCGRRSGEWT